MDTSNRNSPPASAGRAGEPEPSPMPGGMDPAGMDPAAAAQARLLEAIPLLRTAAGMVIAAVVIAALYFGKDILIPITLAALLGFLLDPLVTRLKRWGLPRALAVAIVSLCTLVLLVGMGTYLVSQLRGLSADLPAYQDTIREKLLDLRAQIRAPSAWDGALSTFDVVRREITVGADGDAEAGTAAARRSEPMPVIVTETEQGPARTALAWMSRIGSPAATAGIVALFVVLMLLDRDALRDRMLRLTGGGDLHMATDALHEAGSRIGRYLRMQLVVNVSYGVPLALGLYLIGVPGAFLWGFVAVLLRFVPYLGPLISGLFPLVLAFAVDPDWSMVLWTIALIASLELISNNLVEPWLYGSSTGMPALTIIIAATFWTAMWGPIGLILSTPLTVCLLVMGRYVRGMGFFEDLLGRDPVLDAPNRLYQRLLAGDVADATELATDRIDEAVAARDSSTDTAEAVTAFYDTVAIPALRIASSHHTGTATARHRLQLTTGMQELLRELAEDYPPAPASAANHRQRTRVVCLAARWEMDAMAARMTEHALRLHGIEARSIGTAPGGVSGAPAQWVADEAADIVCVSVFHPQPQAVIRLIARKLRRRLPRATVIVLPWSLPIGDGDAAMSRLPIQGWAGSIRELAHRLLLEQANDQDPAAGGDGAAGIAEPGDGRRDRHDHGLFQRGLRDLHRQTIGHVANAFDVDHAQVSLADGADLVIAASTLFPEPGDDETPARLPATETACRLVLDAERALVIEDTDRDPRVARLPAFIDHKIRFYAGVPLRLPRGRVVGSLCIMDDAPRRLAADELELLQSLADQLVGESLAQVNRRGKAASAADDGIGH